MSTNRRIFWAVYAVGIAPYATESFVGVIGLQSVGMNTKFNLEQAFEVGQLALYENIENLPDVEVTLEKVLDGTALLYHSATQNAPDGTLVGRSNQRCQAAISFYTDTNSSASGTPLAQVEVSGLYLQQVSYNLSVDGNFRESVTLVGNNKTWLSSGFTFTPTYTDADTAASHTPEGINRRQHFLMASSIFPTEIPGIASSSVAGNNNLQADGSYAVHVQSYKVSADLGRDQLHELGHKGPYFRYVNFPVEVKSDIEILAQTGDMISATESGVLTYGNNLTPQHIYVQTTEGTKIDTGTQNKLSSVNYGGANAGQKGGNAHITYSYLTFNDFLVKHPQDPTVGLRG